MILRYSLFAAILALLSACGGDGASSGSATTGAGSALYREGQHYQRLPTAIAAADNEVVEVFSYACPACAQFQPEIDTWKRERGDAVSFRYVPAEFRPDWEPAARAFHTAHALGAFSRLHRAIFAAMYQQGRPGQTLEQLADIAVVAGIDRERFLTTARSPEVEAAMETSRAYVRSVEVGSTPTLIVAGRYRVERTQAGGTALAVADWLLANKP